MIDCINSLQLYPEVKIKVFYSINSCDEEEIKKYRLCVPNQNPEMTTKDFKVLLQEGKLPYTFMYQGIKQCNE